MKKRMLYIGAIIAALSFAAASCGSPEAQQTLNQSGVDTTEKIVSNEEAASTEIIQEIAEADELSDAELMELKYGIIVEKYLTAITDQWTMEDLENNSMSPLLLYHYEKGVDSVGVTGGFDLDHDGTPELLIGDMSEDSDKMVYAAYTMKDGEAVPVFISSERNRYYLINLVEDDLTAVNIYNVGSNSASNSFNVEYTVDKDQLNVVQAIIYNDEENPDKPWYMSYDNDMNLANAESIDEREALAIIEANDSNIADPSYIPLTMGFLYNEGLASPIYDVSLDELLKATNLSLLPVDDAEDVNYAIIDQGAQGKMAEMNFIKDGKNYCYRAMTTSKIRPFDISGLYYVWDKTEEVDIKYCKGIYISSEDASNIYWLDVVPGVAYSLSVIQPTDKDELVDLANKIFIPTQGED